MALDSEVVTAHSIPSERGGREVGDQFVPKGEEFFVFLHLNAAGNEEEEGWLVEWILFQ